MIFCGYDKKSFAGIGLDAMPALTVEQLPKKVNKRIKRSFKNVFNMIYCLEIINKKYKEHGKPNFI